MLAAVTDASVFSLCCVCFAAATNPWFLLVNGCGAVGQQGLSVFRASPDTWDRCYLAGLMLYLTVIKVKVLLGGMKLQLQLSWGSL